MESLKTIQSGSKHMLHTFGNSTKNNQNLRPFGYDRDKGISFIFDLASYLSFIIDADDEPWRGYRLVSPAY